MGSVV
jgi:hypothetical protein